MKLNFNPTYAVTRNISAKQVYISVPEIPDGYLYVDFRPPKKGKNSLGQ